MAIYWGNSTPGKREPRQFKVCWIQHLIQHFSSWYPWKSRRHESKVIYESLVNIWLTVGPLRPQIHTVVISLVPESIIGNYKIGIGDLCTWVLDLSSKGHKEKVKQKPLQLPTPPPQTSQTLWLEGWWKLVPPLRI